MSNPIVSFDEQAVKDELRELVRKTIEETINAMLDEEADQIVGAGSYERTDERAAYRAGHYERGFTTTSGQVTLKMPKLKGMRFATAVVERYKRRETSVEEAIIEMYLAGVSTRRIEDVGEILWGAGVSAGTVSNLNDKAFKSVEEWRCRPLAREYPYVYVDGIYLKRSWGGSYENVAVMAAIGVNEDGYREVIGCAESSERWRDFLSWLKPRGLRGVRMFAGDKAAGMVGSIAEVFPDAKYQRCTVHFYRNALAKVPKSKRSQARPCSKPSTRWSRAKRRPPPRPRPWPTTWNRCGSRRPPRWCAAGMPRRWLLRDAARALAAHPHEQRDRAAQQGDKAQDPRGRHLSRRQVRAHAGARPPEVRCRQRMEIAPLPGRVASQGAVVLTAG